MTLKNFVFTSESVNEGHPDKVSDQISDTILDALLAGDPKSRVACETMCLTGLVMVGGEVTSSTQIDVQELVRGAIKEIGYDDSSMGFDYRSCAVLNALNKQSPDIAMGVDRDKEEDQGAGDQGMMFGFAVDETPELMPMPVQYAHQLMRRLTQVRKDGTLPFLRPDGKGQVTVQYENGKPKAVKTVVVSTQHNEEITQDQVREGVIEEVVRKVIPKQMLAEDAVYHINPTGRFVVGGPHGDAGLTGRKIIVDTYGGMGRHGGGAFSGKDPSKVDRSAAYMARYIAKNVVASGAATRCEVQLAYAIGVAKPVSVHVDTFGTGKVAETKIEQAIEDVFDCTPRGIVTSLDLLKPGYARTAAYGHFGNPEFNWEKTNRVDALKDALGL
ncbi:MAG: methionine adenosyltransferase [Myxococcota bacterium]